jgi:UDP-N-acetylmuramyl pentapeptide phosphotransferase/UDP-N-acetylglucosamine-1-phosphate transferase
MPAVAVALGAAASWALLCMLLPQLRRRLLDQPNARSSHRLPTPRGGGLAFVLVASTASVLAIAIPAASWTQRLPGLLPLLTLPLALVGVLDDRHNLPASWRYGVQLATALLITFLSPLAQRLSVGLGWWLLPLVVALLLIAVTAVINFINFMDGLDGLVAGCLAIAIAAGTSQLPTPTEPLWALVGALFGFLAWNWSPAKVFMGDVGSTFLGAVFAGLVLQASSWPEALGLLLVATPLLGDACLCVPRRLLAGQRVFQAHRLHLYQRLHQAGWPHARVAGLYIAATALLALALLLAGWAWVLPLAVLELGLGVWLDRRVAMPFRTASQNAAVQRR